MVRFKCFNICILLTLQGLFLPLENLRCVSRLELALVFRLGPWQH